MNEQLAQMAVEAGASEEVMGEMWFHIFCTKFADALITLMEEETV
jgi:hypothetical protein